MRVRFVENVAALVVAALAAVPFAAGAEAGTHLLVAVQVVVSLMLAPVPRRRQANLLGVLRAPARIVDVRERERADGSLDLVLRLMLLLIWLLADEIRGDAATT